MLLVCAYRIGRGGGHAVGLRQQGRLQHPGGQSVAQLPPLNQSYHTSPLDAAAEILWFNGVVVVASAGN